MPAGLGFLAVAGRGLATMTGAVVLTGAVAFSEGTVNIRVHEKRTNGSNVCLFVPALAISLGSQVLPARVFNKIPPHAREMMPALRIASQELERCPDGALVEVRTPRETVTVVKRGGNLVIDVDTPRETVHVAFPLRMATTVIREIEASGPGA